MYDSGLLILMFILGFVSCLVVVLIIGFAKIINLMIEMRNDLKRDIEEE